MNVLLSGIAGAGAAILAVFGAPVSAGLCLAAAVLAGRGRRRLAVVALAVALGTAPLEYPLRIEPLAARVREHGPGALSARDLASVWLLHLGTGVVGYAPFPEVASETLRLVWRGPETRVIASSFPGGATPVRETIRRWEAELRRSSDDAVVFRARPIVVPRTEMRHALALDPVTVSGTAVRDRDRWKLDVVARVPIDYPPLSRLPLFPTPTGTVVIHEGLFDALEQHGWLFPYTAEYRWTEFVVDPP